MQRIFLPFFLVMLVACSSADPAAKHADAIITEAEGINEQILGVLSDRIFAYDLEIKDESIDEVEMSLDVYQDGKFIESGQQFSMPVEEIDQLVLAYVQQIFDHTNEKWVLAVIDENGTSAGTFETDWSKKRDEQLGAIWGNVSLPLYLTKDEKSVVGFIVYSSKDVISSPAAIESDEQLQQLVDDDFVYVLSVEVK